MDAVEELQLIRRVRERDQEAFGQLVDHYQKPLGGFISSSVGNQHVDDIAQDVWSRTYEAIQRDRRDGGYDPTKGRFYTWVINYVAIPRLKDWRRSQSRNARLAGLLEDQKGGPTAATAATSEDWEPTIILEAEEQLRLKVMAYCELFRLTFLCGGYPHQQLAFGFAKHIYGEQSTRTMEGDPRRVDIEHGNEPLRGLLDKYWDSYRTVSQIDDVDVLRSLWESLEPVRVRLPFTVEALIRPLSDCLQPVRGHAVAQTCLRNYYIREDEDHTHPISHWCDRLQERVREMLCLKKEASEDENIQRIVQRQGKGPIQPTGCNRCKLRHVLPCVARAGKEDATTR